MFSVSFPYDLNLVLERQRTNKLSSVWQCIGGAFIVSGSQSAFLNTMVRYVTARTSEISRGELILTGASELRKSFTPEQLPLVLEGYMEGLSVVFTTTIVIVGVAVLISFTSGWKKLNTANLAGGAA